MSLEGENSPVEMFFSAFAAIHLFPVTGTAADMGVSYPCISKNFPARIVPGVLFIAAIVGKLLVGRDVFQDGGNKAVIGSGIVPSGEAGHNSLRTGLSYGVFDSNPLSAKTVIVMLIACIASHSLKIAFAGDMKPV